MFFNGGRESMASWTTHLVIAKKLLEKLDIEDKNAFLLGNILPDLEKWVVTNLEIYIPYTKSHYAAFYDNEMRIDLELFENEHISKLKDHSLAIGYYAHLLTDDYLNVILRNEITVLDSDKNYIGTKLFSGKVVAIEKEKRNKIKHREYRQFDNELVKDMDYIPYPEYDENLLEKIAEMGIDMEKEDLEKIISEGKNRAMIYDETVPTYEYIMFSKELLHTRIDEIVDYIILKLGKRR